MNTCFRIAEQVFSNFSACEVDEFYLYWMLTILAKTTLSTYKVGVIEIIQAIMIEKGL